MTSADETIERLKLDVQAGSGPDEDKLAWLLSQIETRSQLDQIFALAGTAGAAIAERVDAWMRFGDASVERSDTELVNDARSHVDQLLQFVQADEATPDWPKGTVALIEAFAALPVELVASPSSDAIELTGFFDEPAEISSLEAGLTEEHVEQFAGLDCWLVLNDDAYMHELDPLLKGQVLRDHHHVANHLFSPGISHGTNVFDFEPLFRIWEAGATLWASPNRIELHRGSAARFDFPLYSATVSQIGSVPVSRSPDRNAWAENTSGDTERALQALDACEAERRETLDLSGLGLSSLPPGLSTLEHLRYLGCSDNELGTIPPELMSMTQLRALSFDRCGLTQLPEDLGSLRQLDGLSVADNLLRELPASVLRLEALTYLDISGNQVAALPDGVGALAALDQLVAKGNEIASLPASIGQLASLNELSLWGNPLTRLPVEILDLNDDTFVSLVQCYELPEAVQFADTIAALRAVWPSEWN